MALFRRDTLARTFHHRHARSVAFASSRNRLRLACASMQKVRARVSPADSAHASIARKKLRARGAQNAAFGSASPTLAVGVGEAVISRECSAYGDR